MFLNDFHKILVEKTVILEQVLLLQFYHMTSSRDVVSRGWELLLSLAIVADRRTWAGGGFWFLLHLGCTARPALIIHCSVEWWSARKFLWSAVEGIFSVPAVREITGDLCIWFVWGVHGSSKSVPPSHALVFLVSVGLVGGRGVIYFSWGALVLFLIVHAHWSY